MLRDPSGHTADAWLVNQSVREAATGRSAAPRPPRFAEAAPVSLPPFASPHGLLPQNLAMRCPFARSDFWRPSAIPARVAISCTTGPSGDLPQKTQRNRRGIAHRAMPSRFRCVFGNSWVRCRRKRDAEPGRCVVPPRRIAAALGRRTANPQRDASQRPRTSQGPGRTARRKPIETQRRRRNEPQRRKPIESQRRWRTEPRRRKPIESQRRWRTEPRRRKPIESQRFDGLSSSAVDGLSRSAIRTREVG